MKLETRNQRKNSKRAFVLLLTLVIFVGIFSCGGWSYAADCPDGGTLPNCYRLDNPLGATDSIPGLICKILSFLSSKVMPPVAVFMALYASFLLLISVGDPGKVRAARNVLLYAVVGAGIILLSVPLVALVMSIFNTTQTVTGCGLNTATTTFMDTVIKLINWFSWLIGLLSVAVGLYAGFTYMTGRGEPQKVATASKMIVYAVIGIAVAVIAFSIITIVKGFLGV